MHPTTVLKIHEATTHNAIIKNRHDYSRGLRYYLLSNKQNHWRKKKNQQKHKKSKQHSQPTESTLHVKNNNNKFKRI